jgi:predicted transcriptional regulator
MQIPTGQEIREARKALGITQSEVANRADVSQPLIARIEGNDVDPTLATLHRVVAAINGSEPDFGEEKLNVVMPSALKRARKQAGYSQGELANKANVSQPLVSRIERDDVNPRVSTLRSLFEHLDPVTALEAGQASDDEKVGEAVLSDIRSELEQLRKQKNLRDNHK